MNYIDYSSGKGKLNIEINNYLFVFHKMCKDNLEIRRYVDRIIDLYIKIDLLPVDYNSNSIIELRSVRKSARYSKKIQKYIKKVKLVDLDIFSDVAGELSNMNLNSYFNIMGENYLSDDTFFERYAKNNWTSDQIARTLSGDISGILSRKRKEYLNGNDYSINALADVYIDEVISDIDKKSKIIEESMEKNTETNEFDLMEADVREVFGPIEQVDDDILEKGLRILTKQELEQLKIEIDNKEELFIDFNGIDVNQKSIIESYLKVCDKCHSIEDSLEFISENTSTDVIMDIYRKIYSLCGVIIDEYFEQIIHFSKICCFASLNSSNYEEKYVVDQNVFNIFGISDVFLAKIQNYVKELKNKQSHDLSEEQYFELSKELWDSYKLENIYPSSIKEAVSLDILSYISQNPFTLLQSVKLSDRETTTYKKYDLDKLLLFVSSDLEKYMSEEIDSLEKSLNLNKLLSDDEKSEILYNFKYSFAKYSANIHGALDIPHIAYDYAVKFVLNNIYASETEKKDLTKDYEEIIDRIYEEKMEKYRSLSLFKRIVGSLIGTIKKPSKDDIRGVIDNFNNKIKLK